MAWCDTSCIIDGKSCLVILSIRRAFCHKLCSHSCMEPLDMFRAFLSSFFLMHSRCMCPGMQAMVFMCYRCRWQLSPGPSQSLSHVLGTSRLAPDEWSSCLWERPTNGPFRPLILGQREGRKADFLSHPNLTAYLLFKNIWFGRKYSIFRGCR